MKKRGMFILSLTLALIFTAQSVMAGKYTTVTLNGGVYAGYMESGAAHGFGVTAYDGGDAYCGMFNMDVREGFGILSFANDPDGYIHISGDFKNGKLNGQGVMMIEDEYSNIYRYEGAWVDSVIVPDKANITANTHSWSTFMVSETVMYTGEVRYGTEIPHGYGMLVAEGGATHAGIFTDGALDGYGIQSNADHSYFTGVWADGKLTDSWAGEGVAATKIAAAAWPLGGAPATSDNASAAGGTFGFYDGYYSYVPKGYQPGTGTSAGQSYEPYDSYNAYIPEGYQPGSSASQTYDPFSSYYTYIPEGYQPGSDPFFGTHYGYSVPGLYLPDGYIPSLTLPDWMLEMDSSYSSGSSGSSDSDYCYRCDNRGKITCTECHGKGEVTHFDYILWSTPDYMSASGSRDYTSTSRCGTCNGRREITCPSCGGK
jgi:hypothetical protein